MVFNSLKFALFFLSVYVFYLTIPRRWQNALLLLASYLFYAFWDWRFLSIIWLSTAVNFFAGRFIGGHEEEISRKRALVVCIVLNLAILGVFKYFNFFADGLQLFLWAIGIHAKRAVLDIVLPLGISFYTFQAMTYPIDIYRRVIAPTRAAGDFALFVAFFPNLIAGPIERAKNMLPQFAQERRITADGFVAGCWLIFWGLFKKIVVADNLASMTDMVFKQYVPVFGLNSLFAIFTFTFQIYADFSGYSDMARGLGKLMGFDIMRNFRNPFFAANIYDLWQRWHISLTTWIKEYIYYPLALAKFKGRQLAAPLVVMFTWALMGFWHGPDWKFVLWGLYHGVIIVIYNRMRPYLYWLRPRRGIARAAWAALGGVSVFTLFSLGLVFFAAESAGQAASVFRATAFRLFDIRSFSAGIVSYVLPLIAPVIIIESFQFARDDELIVFKWPMAVQAIAFFVIFYYIVFMGNFSAEQYYYFQF